MQNESARTQPTARIKWGLARLLVGLDTDMFENGASPPWKLVGQTIRETPVADRRGTLEKEARRIAGVNWDHLAAELAEIDATKDFDERASGQSATALPEAAPFPVEALPDIIARFVNEGARTLHCPTDYIAPSLLGFLGGAIGGTRRIVIKAGWTEQPLLYVLVVGSSGSKKSPAAKLVSQFAEARAREFAKEFSSQIEEHNQRLDQFDDDLSDYKASRRRHPGSPTCGQRPEIPDKPILKRTIVDDTTVEALVRVLYENPRGVVLHKEELAGLLRGLNQYKGGRGSDESFFQSAWDGKSITVDRKGLARPYLIPRPFLAIVGGIQPGVVPSVLGGMRLEDGMTARFLVAYPELMQQQVSDDVVSEECLSQIGETFQALFGLSPKDETNGNYEPHLVRMSPDAYVEFNYWQKINNDRINALSEYDPRRAPISKMPSQLARLTLITHQVRVHSGERLQPDVLDPESVARAGMIADYFVSHIDRVWHVLGESRPDRQARQLLAWMRKQGTPVTKRDVIRHGVAGIRSTGEAEESLRHLEDAGIVRREKTPRSERFSVVPDEARGDA